MIPCKTGESSCKSEKNGSSIIICTDKRLPELRSVETKSQIVKNGKVDFGDNKQTLSGFSACIDEKSKVEKCQPFAKGCKLITKDNCMSSFGWGIFIN
eukprot:XP_763971.1 hypothetical protein [Theileria parva strain Muguga]